MTAIKDAARTCLHEMGQFRVKTRPYTLLCPPTGYFLVKFHEIYPSIGEMRIHFVSRPTADFGMRVVAPVFRFSEDVPIVLLHSGIFPFR